MAETTERKTYKMLSMGPNTLEFSTVVFELNRIRLRDRLKSVKNLPKNSFVVLQGGSDISVYDSDTNYLFRQEGYFQWAFGVHEPDFFGAIDVNTGKSYLFCPRLDPSYGVWMGKLLTPDDFKQKYNVDQVNYADEIATVLEQSKAVNLLTLKGKNSDSNLTAKPAHFKGIEKFTVDTDILFPEIAECRVIKTQQEMEILRYVNRISSEAHIEVMKKIRPGMKEYQSEATFLNYVYYTGGCRYPSYTCICGSGDNSSILHYGHAGAPNDKTVNDGDMCLFDMGASYYGYTSDITCSFPANGKFTEDQKTIYEAVLRANKSVMDTAKPGVSWVDMHKLANREMLLALIDKKILKGNIDEMMAANLAAVFQPHGLGHLMGVDVHDVGGYLPGTPERPVLDGLKSLRTARVLEAGMVLTIEPGCYFIDQLLNAALADPKLSKFMVAEEINRFRGKGGVRIEDDVVITDIGVESLTMVPRTVEEIEAVMKH